MPDPETVTPPDMTPGTAAPVTAEAPAATNQAVPVTTPAPAGPPPAPKPNEMKVLIAIVGESAMVGVKTPDTDPVFTSVEGGLAGALRQVPGLIEAARAKWATSPRNPRAVLPEPPPAPARAVTPARKPADEPKAPKSQPSFF